MVRPEHVAGQSHPNPLETGETIDWQECDPVCELPSCCSIHMIDDDYFHEECIRKVYCETMANQEDTMCTCPGGTSGGNSRMKKLFEKWRKKQIPSTTTPKPTIAPSTTTTGGTTSSTASPTAAPAALPTRSLLEMLAACLCLVFLLAAALTLCLLWRARKRLRQRNANALLRDETGNDDVVL